MEFIIESASRVPIYRQLVAQIREAIARGRLKADQRLPSVRELSRELVINPNTVARVYTELEREGILNTRPGLGVFVAQPRNELTKRARKERLTCLVDGLLTEAVHLGFTGDEVNGVVAERMEKFAFGEGIGSRE
jgi:GntR family transcriptional regulator